MSERSLDPVMNGALGKIADLQRRYERLREVIIDLVSAHPSGHQSDDLVLRRLMGDLDTAERSSLRALLNGRAALGEKGKGNEDTDTTD